MKYWKSDQIGNCQTLLDFLINAINDDGGIIVDGKNQIAMHEFLCSTQNNILNKSIAFSTLKRMKKEKLRSIIDFERIYEVIRIENKKKIKIRKFEFYIPLYLKVETKLPISFTLIGEKIVLTFSIPYSMRLFNNKELSWKYYPILEDVKNAISSEDYIFVKLTQFSDTKYNAWNKCSLLLDLFRGLLEFAFNSFKLSWGYDAKPYSIVPEPCWVIERADCGDYDLSEFNTAKYIPRKQFILKNDSLNYLRNNTRNLQKTIPTNSIINIIVNSIRLYCDAFDASVLYQRFLKLWQVAEALTLANEFNGNSQKIAKRLAIFGRDLDLIASGYYNILQRMADKRNEIVHEGKTNITEDDINHLKLAVEYALIWFLRNAKKYSSREQISIYYQMMETSTRKLKIIKDTLNLM